MPDEKPQYIIAPGTMYEAEVVNLGDLKMKDGNYIIPGGTLEPGKTYRFTTTLHVPPVVVWRFDWITKATLRKLDLLFSSVIWKRRK